MPHRRRPGATKSDRVNWLYGVDALREIERDIHDYATANAAFPEAWHEIWQEQDRRAPKRQRVTIRLDDDVVRFFKAMGPGYQARMNRVLRAFMHLRLAKVIDGPETSDHVQNPAQTIMRSRQQSRGPEGAAETPTDDPNEAYMRYLRDIRENLGL